VGLSATAGGISGGWVRLESETSESTVLHYDVDAQIGGKLAQRGGRRFHFEKLGDELFTAFGAAVGGGLVVHQFHLEYIPLMEYMVVDGVERRTHRRVCGVVPRSQRSAAGRCHCRWIAADRARAAAAVPIFVGYQRIEARHMRELRVQSGGRPLRVFYAFDPRRSAILLLAATRPAMTASTSGWSRSPTGFTTSTSPKSGRKD
jgi:hypothetical protein